MGLGFRARVRAERVSAVGKDISRMGLGFSGFRLLELAGFSGFRG